MFKLPDVLKSATSAYSAVNCTRAARGRAIRSPRVRESELLARCGEMTGFCDAACRACEADCTEHSSPQGGDVTTLCSLSSVETC